VGLAGRKELFIVGITSALACIAYVWASWYGFDLLEEGYFATHARRVQLGGLPYRDFSTPYTPGIFYLGARLMDWFGTDVVMLRLPQVVSRVVLSLALYSAGRHLMPPFFAALPPILILILDPVPHRWSLHPGWVTTATAALGVLAIARYLQTGLGHWLLVSGLASGVGFAFKQNLAGYGLMAGLWLVVVAERHLPLVPAPRLWRWLSSLRFILPAASNTLPSQQSDAGGRLGRADASGALAGITSQTAARSRTASVAGGLRIAVQLAALVLLPFTAGVLVRSYFSSVVAGLLVLPLAAVSLAAATGVAFRGHAAVQNACLGRVVLTRESSFYARPLLLVIGFSAVTVPWLVLLIKALQGHVALLRGFVGDIDLTAYVLAMPPLKTTDQWLLVAALAPPLLLVARYSSSLWDRRSAMLGLCVCLGLLAAKVIRSVSVRWVPAEVLGVWGAAGPAWSPYAGTGAEHSGMLFLYLPTLAFWAAFAKLLLTLRKETTLTRGTALRLWYLTAGSALLLNQYPRMDAAHMVWSGGVLLVLGADLLHAWYQFLLRQLPTTLRRPGRAVVGLSVVLLPIMAAVPQASDRLHGLSLFAMSQAPALSPSRILAVLYGNSVLGLVQRYVQLTPSRAGASVWAPADQARPIQEVVDFLRQHTAPGEPIFTYPAIPGFYFLADRPNATRFNHVFGGMASPRDQEEMVAQLEAVRYVVWDDRGAHSWVRPGDNARLTEYIHAHFRVERVLGIYTILSRHP
jgi:hypothetical protein